MQIVHGVENLQGRSEPDNGEIIVCNGTGADAYPATRTALSIRVARVIVAHSDNQLIDFSLDQLPALKDAENRDGFMIA